MDPSFSAASTGLGLLVAVSIGWFIARQRPVGPLDIVLVAILVAGVVGVLVAGATTS